MIILVLSGIDKPAGKVEETILKGGLARCDVEGRRKYMELVEWRSEI